MKKQIKIIIVSIIFLIAFYTYSMNRDPRYSVSSGFYENEFELEISAFGNEIYYTLDGTTPTKDSNRYVGSIEIKDATINPNVHAQRTDLTTAFYEGWIHRYTGNTNYVNSFQIPDYLVDKCTIIKSVSYDFFGRKSEVQTAMFFVGYDQKKAYNEYNTISLVTEPDNLFDSEKGIYVTGVTFDDYINGDIVEGSKEAMTWSTWPANYINRGSDWEREAEIFIFDKEGEFLISKDVGIRVQGGWSRVNYPRSLNVYSRQSYDGTTQIELDIWGESGGYLADSFTVSSGGNDTATKFKDRLVSELCINMEVSCFKFEPYNMFLNGEYWGIYHLAEKYTDEYFKHYYQVDPNKLVLVKGGEIEVGTDNDFKEFDELRSFIEGADFTNIENYEYLWTQMDKESMIDHFALMLYFGRTADWIPMRGNSALWKTRMGENSEYKDGKWRWCIYDMNTYGGQIQGYLNNVDSIKDIQNRVPWFNELCKNENFTIELSARLFELMKNDFDENKILQIIDSYESEMQSGMNLHYERFYGSDISEFELKMDDIREFFYGRNNNMKKFIYENFDIEE